MTKAEVNMSDLGKRVYYGPTTEQQRRHMIEVYEATGNKSEACRQAKVSRGTFYRWYPRYLEGGWEAVKEGRSRAAHTHPSAKPPEIVQRVLDLNEEYPLGGGTALPTTSTRNTTGRKSLAPARCETSWSVKGVGLAKSQSKQMKHSRSPQKPGAGDAPRRRAGQDSQRRPVLCSCADNRESGG